MAHINNGHFGSYQGKIGAVTGVKRLGKFYIRQSITHNASKTKSQMLIRQQFTNVTRLLAPFAPAINVGFNHSTEVGQTPINAAVGFNFHRADPLTKEIDPTKLIISRGPLFNISGCMVTCPMADQTLKAVWTNNTNDIAANENDIVYLVAYEARSRHIALGAAKRKDESLGLKVPAEWAGTSVHTFVFTTTEDGSVNSDSAYVSSVSVE